MVSQLNIPKNWLMQLRQKAVWMALNQLKLNPKINGTVGNCQPSCLNFQQIKFGMDTGRNHFQMFLLEWTLLERRIFNLFQIGELRQTCRFRPNTQDSLASARRRNHSQFFLRNIGQSHFMFRLSILGHL
jgi:hypothetical protein